jgi:hypothetical protein
LWNNATGETGPGGATVVISDFGTTVKNNSAAGIAFISAWTSSTISGIGGYNDTNASWRVLSTGGSGGGTFTGGTVTGATIFTNGLTANTISATTYINLPSLSGNYLPLSGGTVTGNTTFTQNLFTNTISATTYQNLPTDVRVTGATKSGTVATFTNNTGGTFTLTGLTDTIFTGGTVSGATNFTSGLTANTITSTSYNGYNPLPTQAAISSGVTLSFITDTVYGTLLIPENGFSISADTTNGQLGVTDIIIHSGSTPTFSSQYKKLSGSSDYSAGTINYIFCTYISSDEIIYSINQRT